MSVWDDSRVVVKHDDQTKLKEFYKKIKDIRTNYLLKDAYVTFNIYSNPNDLYLLDKEVGVYNIDYPEDFIVIQQNNAWSRCISFWNKLIKDLLPDAKIFYYDVDTFSNVFITNDPSYKDKYYLTSADYDGWVYFCKSFDKITFSNIQNCKIHKWRIL